jgi:hypothetical protein
MLNRRKHQSERRFPHKIDVSVPRDGLGPQLSAMLAWCRAHAAAGYWDCHGQRALTPENSPQKVVRFYFADQPIADRFRREWL